MKRALSILLALAALIGAAQESTVPRLQFDKSTISPEFTMPELPGIITPATNIKPTFNVKLPTSADFQIKLHTNSLADSLVRYQQDWQSKNRYTPIPATHFNTDPYSRDWSSGGIITEVGGGYLTGAGSHTTYPGMGDMASASIAFTKFLGDRLAVTAGLTGNKYHFDRSAWNDYGVFSNASFRLNERLSLNAFGQYYFNQRFHSVATMPFLGGASYGGTLGWKASETFSLDMGARRLYDPYTGQWRTLPIVQPTLYLLGAPISFDAGPLIYQVLGNLFGKGKNKQDWGDPRYRPVTVPDAISIQPGFNPNSPIPVPDAFRH